MATTYTNSYTGRDPSATGIQKRTTIGDKVRNLFPGASPYLALVANGEIKKGELTSGKGLISKTSCDGRRAEWFTYTPPAILFTVSNVSGSDITLSSVVGLTLKRTVINLTNMEVGRMSAINTSTGVCAITGIGDASFTAAINDVLLVAMPAYEEASSSPYKSMKDDDNQYNVMQICRFPVKISASAKIQPNLAGGDFFKRLKEKELTQAKRNIEASFIFGERAYTTTTDLTADATLGDSFGTMRGLWNWAQKSFPCGGAMTPEKWIKDLDQVLSDTIDPSQKLVFLTSSRIKSDMQMWAHDRWMITKPGTYDKYGVKTDIFMTGKYEIEVMAHNLFDQGLNQSRGVIFTPEDNTYVFRTGRDLQPKNGIQDNSLDGYEDDLIGELTLQEETGGQNVCRVTDWFLQ